MKAIATELAFWIACLFVFTSLSLSADVNGQGLPSEFGSEQAIGKNLTGDECLVRRIRPGSWGGKAERYQLFCEGWSQPSGQLVVLRQEKQPPAWWVTESDWAQDINASGECESPRAQAGIEGAGVMVRNCLHRLGWRRMMVAAKSGPDLYLADFLPNNATLIERSLQLRTEKAGSTAQGKRFVTIRSLEELVGKDTDLPSIKEIGNVVELSNLAQQQHEARLYRQSERTYQRVLKIQERLFGTGSPALALSLLDMAHPVRGQRRADDAMALVQRAEPMVTKSRDPVLTGKHLHNLAMDAKSRRNEEATVAYSEKMITHVPDRYVGLRGQAYYNLSIAKYQLKDYVGAEAAARKTVEIYDKYEGFDGAWTNRGRMQLVRVLTMQKKFEEAEHCLADALESAEKMYGRTIWWANAKVMEAGLANAMGNPDKALEAYRAFASVAAREEFSCFYGLCFSPYVDLLSSPAGENHTPSQDALREAFSVVQLMDFPVVSTAIDQLAARVGAGDREILSFTREQQDLAEQQARLRAQLMQEIRKPEKNRSKDKEDALDREIHQLGAQLAERELMIQDRFPKYAQLLTRRPVDALRAAELLQPEEGLLYFSHVGDKGYTFLLHQGRITLHPVNLSQEELKQKVAALREGLMTDGGKVRPFNADLAYGLCLDLVGPLLDVPTSIRRLIIIPTGALLSLPPDILVTAPPGSTEKTQWLVRRFSILVVPDVRTLVNLRAMKAPPSAPADFLGVGNPKFIGSASGAAPDGRTSPADKNSRGIQVSTTGQSPPSDPCRENWNVREYIAGLAPLPESADEVQTMSVELGAGKGMLLLGEKATKSELFKADLPAKGIIAFATHGLLPEDLFCENEPSLALAPGPPENQQDDGLLRASEIATLRLNANLVILSACNTAGADGQLGGESLSGLVRAFFFAGALNVLATHWQIASQPTVELTTGMAQKKAQGNSWPDALRESKVRLMDIPATSHPFFWGGFSLVGGG